MFHCLDRPRFVYPCTCWVTSEFLPGADQPLLSFYQNVSSARGVDAFLLPQCMGAPVFLEPSSCLWSNVWNFVNLIWCLSPPHSLCSSPASQPAALYRVWNLNPHPVIMNNKCFPQFIRYELYPLWASVSSFVKWGGWVITLRSLPAQSLWSVLGSVRSDIATVSIDNYCPAVTHLSGCQATSTAAVVT